MLAKQKVSVALHRVKGGGAESCGSEDMQLPQLSSTTDRTHRFRNMSAQRELLWQSDIQNEALINSERYGRTSKSERRIKSGMKLI